MNRPIVWTVLHTASHGYGSVPYASVGHPADLSLVHCTVRLRLLDAYVFCPTYSLFTDWGFRCDILYVIHLFCSLVHPLCLDVGYVLL